MPAIIQQLASIVGLKNVLGNQVNPATKEGLDAIAGLLTTIAGLSSPAVGTVRYAGTQYSVFKQKVDLAATGELIAAPTDGTAIVVVGGHLILSAETTVKFRYDGTTDLTGAETWLKGGGVVWPYYGEWLKVPMADKKLDVVLGAAAQLSGELGFIRVNLPD